MKSGQNEKKIQLFEFAQQFHVSLFSYKLLSTSSIFQFHKISTNNNNNTEEQTESESSNKCNLPHLIEPICLIITIPDECLSFTFFEHLYGIQLWLVRQKGWHCLFAQSIICDVLFDQSCSDDGQPQML